MAYPILSPWQGLGRRCKSYGDARLLPPEGWTFPHSSGVEASSKTWVSFKKSTSSSACPRRGVDVFVGAWRKTCLWSNRGNPNNVRIWGSLLEVLFINGYTIKVYISYISLWWLSVNASNLMVWTTVYSSFCEVFSPPVRWGLLDFMSVSSPPSRPRPPPSPPRRLPSPCPVAILCVQCGMSDLNCDPVSSVWRAGLQPRCCEFSVACWTSTAILRVQCGVPDPNRDPAHSVWRPGPQPRSCEFSVASRTPTAILWVPCGVPDLKYCVRKFVRKNDRRYVRKNDRRYVRRNVKKICQKICQKECQKICQKDVRKNVRRYVRKNVKRYVRKNGKRYVRKNVRR